MHILKSTDLFSQLPNMLSRLKKGFSTILNDIKKEWIKILTLLFFSAIVTGVYKLLTLVPSIYHWNIDKVIYQLIVAVLLLICFIFFKNRNFVSNIIHISSIFKKYIIAIKSSIKKEKSLLDRIIQNSFAIIISLIIAIFILVPLLYMIFGAINTEITEIVFRNIVFIAVVALSEEILFRGLIMPLFFTHFTKIKSYKLLSIFVSSIMFGIAHLPNASLGSISDLILMGAISGTMFIISRNIWLSVLFHFYWDVIMTMLKSSNKDITVLSKSFNVDSSFSVVVILLILLIFIGWVYDTGKS